MPPDPARLLKIVHEDDEDTQPGVVAVMPGTQLTRKEQAKATAVHAARQGWGRFAASGQREGALLHALLNLQSRSAADHAEHADSRAWVPPGCEDGWVEEWGMRHHRWIALPATALGHVWIGVAQSPLATLEATAALTSAVVPLAIALSGPLGALAGFFTAVGILATVLFLAAFAACAAMIREGSK